MIKICESLSFLSAYARRSVLANRPVINCSTVGKFGLKPICTVKTRADFVKFRALQVSASRILGAERDARKRASPVVKNRYGLIPD